MDLSGVLPHCNYCANVVQPGQPITQLLCGHQFHTECAIFSWNNDLQCHSCETPLFTREIKDTIDIREREEEETKEQEFIKGFKAKENAMLREDVKRIKKQFANLRRAKAAFTNMAMRARREYRQDMDPLVRLAKAKQKDFLRKLKDSPEIRGWRSARQKTNSLINQYNAKHLIPFHTLLTYRSLKLPGRWDYRGLTNIWGWRIRRFARIL